jgi:DNA-binding MltR family transcriptional regulator
MCYFVLVWKWLKESVDTYRYCSVEIIALIDEISKPNSMPPTVAMIARK